MNTSVSRISPVVILVAFASLHVHAAVVAPTMTDTHYGSQFLKIRYLTIDPLAGGENAGELFGIRVTLTGSMQFEDATGMTWWVGAPDENCIAGLVDDVSFSMWDDCPELHITGCGVVPGTTYRLVAVDGDGDSPTFLDHETVPRALNGKWWGDNVGNYNGAEWTPPQGVASIDDAVAIIKGWQYPGTSADPGIPVIDLAPRVPNRTGNFDDVYAQIFGFKGYPYHFGCPHDPCWDNFTTPCP
jgi:hypothetical protein